MITATETVETDRVTEITTTTKQTHTIGRSVTQYWIGFEFVDVSSNKGLWIDDYPGIGTKYVPVSSFV